MWTRTVILSQREWDERTWNENRPMDVIIEIVDNRTGDTVNWAWVAPDGIGAFYYDTKAELVDQHC